jgi:methylglyoxal synthase
MAGEGGPAEATAGAANVERPLKTIALVAHDNRKTDMLEWANWNREILTRHRLCATGTTGALVEAELGVPVELFRSGPLGGDQQVGAAIAEGKVDVLIFFWDPLKPQPHDVDVKALLRIATLYNIPCASNRASADFMISSALMSGSYERITIAADGLVVQEGAFIE